jgi:hypothetical protein
MGLITPLHQTVLDAVLSACTQQINAATAGVGRVRRINGVAVMVDRPQDQGWQDVSSIIVDVDRNQLNVVYRRHGRKRLTNSYFPLTDNGCVDAAAALASTAMYQWLADYRANQIRKQHRDSA